MSEIAQIGAENVVPIPEPVSPTATDRLGGPGSSHDKPTVSAGESTGAGKDTPHIQSREEELQKAVQDAYHRYAQAASDLNSVNELLEGNPQDPKLLQAKETALFLENFYEQLLTAHRIAQQEHAATLKGLGITPKY